MSQYLWIFSFLKSLSSCQRYASTFSMLCVLNNCSRAWTQPSLMNFLLHFGIPFLLYAFKFWTFRLGAHPELRDRREDGVPEGVTVHPNLFSSCLCTLLQLFFFYVVFNVLVYVVQRWEELGHSDWNEAFELMRNSIRFSVWMNVYFSFITKVYLFKITSNFLFC